MEKKVIKIQSQMLIVGKSWNELSIWEKSIITSLRNGWPTIYNFSAN